MGEIDLGKKRQGGAVRPPKGARRFAILRVGKISGKAKLAAAAQHNFRERETPNADPERLARNRTLMGASNTADLLTQWDERAPEKIRKNAVHALEYVVTASPEMLAEMGAQSRSAYFEDALDWLKDKHGAENILSAVVHQDEVSPHLQVLVIPLDERGKLNARALVGGKSTLRQMQTDFATRVGAKHGLERGVERSGARHQTIQSYYARAQTNETLAVRLPERQEGGFLGRGGETFAEWSERASESLSETLRANAARSDAATLDAEHAHETANQALRDIDQLQTQVDHLQLGLKITEALTQTYFGDAEYWDDRGLEALKLYREHYDQLPPAAQNTANTLLRELETPTIPEQREAYQKRQEAAHALRQSFERISDHDTHTRIPQHKTDSPKRSTCQQEHSRDSDDDYSR